MLSDMTEDGYLYMGHFEYMNSTQRSLQYEVEMKHLDYKGDFMFTDAFGIKMAFYGWKMELTRYRILCTVLCLNKLFVSFSGS